MRLSRVLACGALLLLAATACSRGPASIDISPKKTTIYGLGRTQRLQARLLDKKGQPVESGTPDWTSSNPAVVAAEVGGRLVAKSAGKAMVTASYEEISAQVPVEVVDVASVEVRPPSLLLIGPAGTSVPLSIAVLDSRGQAVAMKPTWSSSDPKIVGVTDQGLLSSVGRGVTTVVAKVGDLQGACEVTVNLRPIERIEIRPATALVHTGDSQRFQVTAYGPDGTPISEIAAVYQSSNPAVATVDAAGNASGHKPGAAIIRVELAGRTAEATLLVN